MELQLTGPKTLTLPSQAVAYILDKLAKCPFNEVQQLIGDIFAQLKEQENEITSPRTSPVPHGLQPAKSAD